MSIVHIVGRGVAWTTMSTILGKVIIFANVFLMLRYLTVYEYGLGQLVLSVVSTLGIFMLPGLSNAILADLAAERGTGNFGKMKSLFWQFSIGSVILGAVAWALLFFGSNITAHIYGNDMISNFLKIASFSLLIAPLRVIANMLAGVELRYFDQSFYPILEEVAKCIFLVLFLLVFPMGLSGMLLAVVLSQLVTVLAYIPRSLSAYGLFGAARSTDLRAFWLIVREHRKWSIVTSYIGNLGQTLSLWIIKFFLGTEAVGIFSFAHGIYSQVASFLPLGNILVPLLPRYVGQRDVFARYVKSAIKAQFLLAIPLIGATFIGLPILVLIFPKYLPAVPLIQIMIFSLIPTSVGNLYITAFTALKEQYMFFHSTVWKILFIATLSPLAIMVWGAWGMAIGVVLISLATAIERSIRLKRVLPEFTFTLRDTITFDAYERALFENLSQRVIGLLALLRRRA